MVFFFLRLLPVATALVAGGLSWWQWRHPLTYPWPLFAALLVYLVSVGLLGVRRLFLANLIAKSLPSLILLVALAGAFVLASKIEAKLLLSLLFAGAMYVNLDLLFLLTRAPKFYPVHGLSRLNVAFAVLAVFFLTLFVSGLYVFLQLDWWWIVTSLVLCGMFWMFFTSHPSSALKERVLWALIGGGLIAGQIALLLLVIPVAMALQAVLAAFLFFIPLRLRRYAYHPVPSRRTAWVEGTLLSVLFMGLLFGARWI